MAFVSKDQLADEADEVRALLDAELGAEDLTVADDASASTTVDAEDAPRSASGRADRKMFFRIAIGGAIAVTIIYLLNRWLDDPELASPGPLEQAPEPVDVEVMQSAVDIAVDADGYSIAGERISTLAAGVSAFLLASDLNRRGIVPGTTTIRLDVTQAPKAEAVELEQVLRERGFEVAIYRLPMGAGRG